MAISIFFCNFTAKSISTTINIMQIRHIFLFSFLWGLSLTGNIQAQSPESIPTTPQEKQKIENKETEARGEAVVKTALQYLGTRYRRGASSPKGFDCSGFTSYVYKKHNMPITRSSRQQYMQGKPIKEKSQLAKGDLVFFGGSRKHRTVGHVGIVTEVNGNTFKFVHASVSKGVKIENSTHPYYTKRYIGARRIFDVED